MDFKKIPIILKRYDFDSKMKICQKHSIETMSIYGQLDVTKLINNVLPWELETFALFSVITLNEYSNQKFEDNNNIKHFSQIINSIKDYRHPKLSFVKENKEFLDYFLIVTGLTQFQIQENSYYKVYRYSYMFNFKNEAVDMNERFIEKFNCTYEDFKELGQILNFIYASKVEEPRILSYVLKKYNHVVQHLQIEREEYILLQEKITQSIEQYTYGFKYFFQFPFIKYNKIIYLPLPHLIMQSVTSSLLFRLTEEDPNLRGLFGKEVLENYILHISGLSNEFDEVAEELSYRHKKNNRRTLDVMILKGDQCFLIDSKSMSPKVSLRDLTEKEMIYTIDLIVKSVVQVYRHLTERFQVEYYPFHRPVDFLPENIFGAVILFEDSFIRREVIMKKASEVLNIEYGSGKYKYLCSNVKLISLYELERIIFQQEDIFQSLTENSRDDSKWFDYTISNNSQEDKDHIKEINQVFDDAKRIMVNLVNEIEQDGLSL